MKKFEYKKPFRTELGAELPGIEIAYHTWGRLNSDADNVIWVCHALTANSDVEAWWPGMVGKGLLFDTDKYFIVCANVLGSCYGTTGPASVNPLTGKPWLRDFPRLTIRDLVDVHEILRNFLRIKKIHSVIGASIGGFQALEYSIMHPEVIQHLIFVASSMKQSPWAIAFSQSQRLAMEADPTFLDGDPEGGKKGLKAARSIALLSYRNSNTYNKTQAEDADEKTSSFKAASYQDHQGDKLVKRFNPYSYYCIVNMSDTHNIGRGRGGTVKALKSIKAKTLCIGITSDLLFPVHEQKLVAEHVSDAKYSEIDSFYGHDGFLIESDIITKVIREFWNNNQKN
ncbi:MAG TPA: homoserine O-acetyltransferase [Bacteroidales bacterium]|jgi:homoserine O-acetyltransferase|nr:homoserine O-acetyltransferase [Bacteroidales bacterium]